MTGPEMTDEYDSEGLGLRRRRGQSIPRRLRLRISGCQAARHWPSAAESTPGPALTQTSTRIGITPGSSHESSVSCQWTRHRRLEARRRRDCAVTSHTGESPLAGRMLVDRPWLPRSRASCARRTRTTREPSSAGWLHPGSRPAAAASGRTETAADAGAKATGDRSGCLKTEPGVSRSRHRDILRVSDCRANNTVGGKYARPGW